MSQLALLQQGFQAYLMSESADGEFRQQVVDDARVGAARRLAIYHDAYRLRLIEALSSAYPKLHVLLGDELFERMARSYVASYPSHYRNLRWYGTEMGRHLMLALPQHPVAAELAEFEWTLSLAFDEADAPALTLVELAGIAPEAWGELRFAFHPSLHTLPMRCNVVAVWQALDQEQAPPTVEQSAAYVHWLIWRQDYNVHFRSLDSFEEAAIRAALLGASFAEVCANLEETLDEESAAMTAAQYLATWLQDGIICRLRD